MAYHVLFQRPLIADQGSIALHEREPLIGLGCLCWLSRVCCKLPGCMSQPGLTSSVCQQYPAPGMLMCKVASAAFSRSSRLLAKMDHKPDRQRAAAR
jgi:hypothetical protein